MQQETQMGLWQRLPEFIRALIMGFAVVASATWLWVVLVSANLQQNPALPWSVAAMAAFLIIYWLFLDGRFGPRATAERRRQLLHAHPLDTRVRSWALLSLVLGFFAAFIFLVAIYARLVDVPAAAFPATGSTPWYAVVAYIVMIGAVAGVAEEAGYRGYMQSELTRAYGATFAIVVTAIVFTAAHMSLALAPFILAVGLLLGTVAYLAGSIRPGAWVHAGYDSLVTTLLWQFGYPKTGHIDLAQGVDDAFIIACVVAAVATVGSIWAMTELKAAARTA